MSQDEFDNEICASTQFLQIQKNQLIDLQVSLERYCNVLPVFGFNSTKYDLNLIKSYLLPILVNERDIEPTVIKKANQFISLNFVDFQIFDIMNFLGGATGFDSFLKAYKCYICEQIRRGRWRSLRINIGYSEPTGAETREGTST